MSTVGVPASSLAVAGLIGQATQRRNDENYAFVRANTPSPSITYENKHWVRGLHSNPRKLVPLLIGGYHRTYRLSRDSGKKQSRLQETVQSYRHARSTSLNIPLTFAATSLGQPLSSGARGDL